MSTGVRSKFITGLLIGLGCSTLAVTREARGWGRQGHELVAGMAAEVSGTDFWQANRKSLERLTNVPDDTWKSKETKPQEAPNHFFQIDYYFDNPNQYSQYPRSYGAAKRDYGEDVVVENGTAPWRIHQFYKLAVEALKKGDYERALQMAGVMTHYTGDLSQPLHVTFNYDGAESGNKGIHSFFETMNIDTADKDFMAAIDARVGALKRDPSYLAQLKGSLLTIIFRSIDRSHAELDQVLELDRRYGRSGQGAQLMRKVAANRIADGIVTTAFVLKSLWQESGLSDRGVAVKMKVPEFVLPSFDSTATVRRGYSSPSAVRAQVRDWLLQDDCLSEAHAH